MTDDVLIERDGGVLIVTFNRPAKKNALTRAMGQIESLCQREDACEVIGQLLRQIDAPARRQYGW